MQRKEDNGRYIIFPDGSRPGNGCFGGICMQGAGHVRVSFYPDEVIISDLFVSEEQRNKGYGTSLLNYVDELVEKFEELKGELTPWSIL